MKLLFAFLLLPFLSFGQIHIDASNPTNRGITITSPDSIGYWSFQAFDFDGQIYCVPANKVSTGVLRPWSADHQTLVSDAGGYFLNPARKQGQMACGWLRSGLYCTGDTMSNMVLWAVPDTCNQPTINVTDIGGGNALIEWGTFPDSVRPIVSMYRYLNSDGTGGFGVKSSTLPYIFKGVGATSDPDGIGWLRVDTGCELGWNHLNPGRYWPINSPASLRFPLSVSGWYIENRQLKFGL